MRRSRRESVLGGTDIRKLRSAGEGFFQLKVPLSKVKSLGFRGNEEEIRLGFRLREMKPKTLTIDD
jgi:hypothetical protein